MNDEPLTPDLDPATTAAPAPAPDLSAVADSSAATTPADLTAEVDSAETTAAAFETTAEATATAAGAGVAIAATAPVAGPPPSAWPSTPDPAANPAWARTVETPIAPVPTSPPNPSEQLSRGKNTGLRWGVALLVIALVIGVSAAGLFLISAGATTSSLLGYVPADSVAYFELRLDAPGDQRQNAANVLAKFPGFADQANLGTKIDETLDQAIGKVSDGKESFTGDIKPWLGNSMALAVTKLPTMTHATTSATSSDGGAVWLVQIKDPNAAQAWAAKTLGAGTSTTTYGGVTLTLVSKDGQQLAYGIVDAVLVAGDQSSVQQVIDTNGNSAFATSASVTAATTATSGDRLAFGYIDTATIVKQATAAAPSPLPSAAVDAIAKIPPWVSISVRAETDGVSTTVATPAIPGTPGPANSVSTIAPQLPATTMVEAEVHDLGPLLIGAYQAAEGQPGAPDFEKVLNQLGGANSLFGWIGDAALVVNGGEQPASALVVEAASDKVASDKLVQLQNLVGLAGASAGIKTHDETYNGTTITIIDAGAVPSDLGSAGSITAIPKDAHVELALAQDGNLVILGVGDSVVKAIIDTKPGSSLADQDRYKTAINRAGSSNATQLYVDLPAVIGYASSRMAPADQAQFKANIAPYLAPLQAFAVAGITGDPNKAVSVITVK